MNKTVVTFIREKIKEGLAQLEEKNHILFKRMYAFGDLDRPINSVVDDMPEEKLNWALTQVENSLKKKRKVRR